MHITEYETQVKTKQFLIIGLLNYLDHLDLSNAYMYVGVGNPHFQNHKNAKDIWWMQDKSTLRTLK